MKHMSVRKFMNVNKKEEYEKFIKNEKRKL